GLVTEPLIAELQIGRVDYAQLNLWATLVGSLCAIGIGRFVDQLGARIVLTTVVTSLGIVVCAMSAVQGFWALAVAVTLTRGLGQSALSVVSLAMVGQWFAPTPAGAGAGRQRRGEASPTIDTAMAVYSIVMSIGFMIAFPVVGMLVQSWGWRFAWLSIGFGLLAVLAPLSLLARRHPVHPTHPTHLTHLTHSTHFGAAVATPAFWTFSVGAALYGLVASGIGLFNESILAERGFSADVYYQTLVVTAITALAGNFGGGWLATRMPLPTLLAISLSVLAAGLAALPHVTTIVQVMAWAIAMGLGGGLVMVLFFSVWPRVYGRAHLGRIQGAAQAMTVLASAIGPLLLAACVEWTGSYAGMFNILSVIIALAAVSALLTPVPAAAAAEVA
ncbi:MAG TPA: MFS transporter, partial [Vicinamibacterales bacterium]|nr:MFS transporter [Vicinamibacterales bacterium]